MGSNHKHADLAIDYVEFVATDLDATKRFYEKAFGWTFNDYGPDYAGFVDQKGGKEGGGFRRDAAVAKGGPLVVLYSREIEATLARVREAGGKVVKEIFTFPGGRRFHFADPSGNELGVWSDQ
jgi:predicted enzyme related to lactoylglutathione lyase